jgi:hypothetical protein
MRPAVAEYRFACVSGCTQCCRQPGAVTLTREDVVRIAQYLGMSIRRFEKKHTERVDGYSNLRLQGKEQRCPFLGGNDERGWCRVHAAKPTQCATYPFWPHIAASEASWAREAQICPGIGQGEVVPPELVQIQVAAAGAVSRAR